MIVVVEAMIGAEVVVVVVVPPRRGVRGRLVEEALDRAVGAEEVGPTSPSRSDRHGVGFDDRRECNPGQDSAHHRPDTGHREPPVRRPCRHLRQTASCRLRARSINSIKNENAARRVQSVYCPRGRPLKRRASTPSQARSAAAPLIVLQERVWESAGNRQIWNNRISRPDRRDHQWDSNLLQPPCNFDKFGARQTGWTEGLCPEPFRRRRGAARAAGFACERNRSGL